MWVLTDTLRELIACILTHDPLWMPMQGSLKNFGGVSMTMLGGPTPQTVSWSEMGGSSMSSMLRYAKSCYTPNLNVLRELVKGLESLLTIIPSCFPWRSLNPVEWLGHELYLVYFTKD